MEYTSTIQVFGKTANDTIGLPRDYAINDEPLGDAADLASRFTETYNMEARHKVIYSKMLQAERALQRKQLGLQTQCEGCGKPIPEERLAVQPNATRCLDCQAKWESLTRGKCRVSNVPTSTQGERHPSQTPG